MIETEIENRFTYHKPTGTQAERYEYLRSMAKGLARVADTLCPDSREKSHGITQLEDAVMWFNAAIARNEDETLSRRPVPGMTVAQSAEWAAGYTACRIAMRQKAELFDAIQEESRQLSYAIERMPAGEQQTALSQQAAALAKSVYNIVQAMAS